jgi:hypothetical protein
LPGDLFALATPPLAIVIPFLQYLAPCGFNTYIKLVVPTLRSRPYTETTLLDPAFTRTTEGVLLSQLRHTLYEDLNVHTHRGPLGVAFKVKSSCQPI